MIDTNKTISIFLCLTSLPLIPARGWQMIQKQRATAGGKAPALLTQVISWPQDESYRIESHPKHKSTGWATNSDISPWASERNLEVPSAKYTKTQDKSSLWNLKSKQEIHWFHASSLKPWVQITVKFFTPPDTRMKTAMNSGCSRDRVPLLPLLVILQMV